MSVKLDIPDVVRERALANKTAGHRWLATLPEVVADLTTQWELTIGGTYHGGTAAFVASAARSDGRRCVLKVAMPLDHHEQDSFARSVTSYALAQGQGCVELLEYDSARSSLLLEELGPNLDELGYSVDKTLQVIAATLQTLWRPVSIDCGLPTGAYGAGWLRDFIVEKWEQLGHPCNKTVIDQAVRYCDERAAAFDPKSAVLVHGDAHGWNTLATTASEPISYKLVDIEGLASEPAHDLSVPMREYNEPLIAGDTPRLARQRAADLAAWCDVDPDAIWQWGFIERVSTGLANLVDFTDGSGELFLEVAARCVDR